MQLKLIYRVTSKILINRIKAIRRKHKWNVEPDSEIYPFWVLGMFRSGTSLTSQILIELGLDFGPQSHLLQPVGRLKDLNPNGFFENYIFAEYSRYFFTLSGGKGDEIPEKSLLVKADFKAVDVVKLFELSLFNYNEDRISLVNKFLAFRKLVRNGLNGYLRENFNKFPCVKIPMLSHFYQQIQNVWPNSKFIIVFRHPNSLLKSTSALTQNSSYDLYNDYYDFLLEIDNITSNYIFFSYDYLIKYPEESISILSKELNLGETNLSRATKLIDVKLIRNIPDSIITNSTTKRIYESMLSKAINNHKLHESIHSEDQ